MGTREELHYLLEDLFGSENIYFQPPAGFKMVYPAIRYSVSNRTSEYANDKKYLNKIVYEITVIDRVVDNPVIEEILNLPYSSYNRGYKADNLYHDVLTLYY